jgi:hypothetical protein
MLRRTRVASDGYQSLLYSMVRWYRLLYENTPAGMRDGWKFACQCPGPRSLCCLRSVGSRFTGARKQYPGGSWTLQGEAHHRSGMMGFGRQCSMCARGSKMPDRMKPRASRRASPCCCSRASRILGRKLGALPSLKDVRERRKFSLLGASLPMSSRNEVWHCSCSRSRGVGVRRPNGYAGHKCRVQQEGLPREREQQNAEKRKDSCRLSTACSRWPSAPPGNNGPEGQPTESGD